MSFTSGVVVIERARYGAQSCAAFVDRGDEEGFRQADDSGRESALAGQIEVEGCKGR